MKKKLISSKAPNPIGPYSVAVNYGNLIFTSGQIPLDKKGNVVGTNIKTQTRQTIENLKNILEENGSSIEQVIKTTVYLKDITEFTEMNEVYNEYFEDSAPARSTLEAARLPKDVKIEIDIIAYQSQALPKIPITEK
jgi:2-iminobutanoate/2-iminopropanoate deaminase